MFFFNSCYEAAYASFVSDSFIWLSDLLEKNCAVNLGSVLLILKGIEVSSILIFFEISRSLTVY